MTLPSLLARLRLDPNFMQRVAAWEKLPPRPAKYGPFPDGLNPMLAAALQARGLERLYSHQSAAVSAGLRGENVVVVTSTASGKTLCYNLPVLQALLADPNARALYLFPTKALAQDQASELGIMNGELRAVGRNSQLAIRNPQLAIRIYDGDTPQSQRSAIRREAQLLISNPDMLHAGILPHHTRWAELFTGLRFVVLDELHTYRGVFGSHVANLIRRLRRICRFYGSKPQFICTSATIANPKELAEKLIEAPVTLVPPGEDGSPRAEKHFILYNPPVIDPTLGIRRAYTLESKKIAGEFLGEDVQTVVFGRARRTVEVLLGYVRDEAQQRGGPSTLPAVAGQAQAVRGYRGGYLPDERRAIERGLCDGTVRGVVATNALELGVDIGQLGAAVIAGYPGSIASLWQQAGRAGRRSETSAVVFVASGAPLDQYIARHPRYIFESSPEHGLIDPDNLAILVQHLRCAAFELPFAPEECGGEACFARSLGDVTELLEILREDGDVHRANGNYHWIADTYPAERVSLRSGGDDTIVIQDLTEERPVVIGEMDMAAAPVHLHEGAVYLHEGRQFIVEQLDWERRIANVKSAGVDYYTEAAEAVDVSVTETREADERAPACRAHGRVRVVSQATSYRTIKRYSHETLGYGTIDLPAREMETTAYWLWIGPAAVEQLESEGLLLAPNDYGPNWEAQRNAARARDGFRCQHCGRPEAPSPETGKGRGGGHPVHHLRPFREFGYVRGQDDNYRAANAIDNLITLCSTCHHRVETARGTRTALGGMAHALGNIAPLFLMCDPRDIAVAAEQRDRVLKAPAIYICDRVPDGLGFSVVLYERHAELLAGAYDLVSECPCQEGCPACIGPVYEGGETKRATLQLLKALIRH